MRKPLAKRDTKTSPMLRLALGLAAGINKPTSTVRFAA